MENQVKDYSTQLVRLKTKRDLQEATTADEQKTFSNLASNKGEMERNLAEKDNSYSKINHQYETFKKEHDQKMDELQKKSELLQTLTTGISAEEGHESGYMEQLQSEY